MRITKDMTMEQVVEALKRERPPSHGIWVPVLLIDEHGWTLIFTGVGLGSSQGEWDEKMEDLDDA